MDLIIDSGGRCRLVYDEAIDWGAVGTLYIQRASHVEPITGGNWQADLTPVGGPVLGPFEKRSKALAAETKWLAEHWLLAFAQ